MLTEGMKRKPLTHNILAASNNDVFDYIKNLLLLMNESVCSWLDNSRLSLMYRNPSSSKYPTSPVRSQPSFVTTASVASNG